MTDSASFIRTCGLSVTEINEYFRNVLMLENYKGDYFRVFDVVISVQDNSEHYNYERKYEEPLDDVVTDVIGFRPTDFNIDVEFYCVPGGIGSQVVDVITYEIARKISFDRRKPVIVYLWCEDNPVILFDGGKIIKTYVEEMKHHFKNSHWVPKSLT